MVAGEFHDSPLENVGIENSDGVRGCGSRGTREGCGEPEKRVSVASCAIRGLRGELVADHLARFGDAKTREPEQRMPRDEQSDEFVEKIFCEVAATHVRELVGEGGGEVFVREIGENRWREKDDAAADADGGGAGDRGGRGELRVVHSEDASAALPDEEWFAGE